MEGLENLEFKINKFDNHFLDVTLYDHDGYYHDNEPYSYDLFIDYSAKYDEWEFDLNEDFESVFKEYMDKIEEDLYMEFCDFTQIGRSEGNFYGGLTMDELKTVKGFNECLEKIKELGHDSVKKAWQNDWNIYLFRELVKLVGISEKLNFHLDHMNDYEGILSKMKEGDRSYYEEVRGNFFEYEDFEYLRYRIEEEIYNKFEILKRVNDRDMLYSKDYETLNIILLGAYKTKDKIARKEYLDKFLEAINE